MERPSIRPTVGGRIWSETILNVFLLKRTFDIILDHKVTTGIEISKVGGNVGSPWMVVHTALFPGLFKSTCFWIIKDYEFFVSENKVVRWWELFVIRIMCSFPFTTITPEDVAKM